MGAGPIAYNVIKKQETRLHQFVVAQQQTEEILEFVKTLNFGESVESSGPGTIVSVDQSSTIPIDIPVITTLDEFRDVVYPFTKENITRILYVIGLIESEHNYTIVNSLGYAGCYQFGKDNWNELVRWAIAKGYLKRKIKYDKRYWKTITVVKNGKKVKRKLYKFHVSKSDQDLMMKLQIKLKTYQLRKYGITPSLFTIYAAHQQGSGGYKNIYRLVKNGKVKGMSTKAKLSLIRNILNNIRGGARYSAVTWTRVYKQYVNDILVTMDKNNGKVPKGTLGTINKNATNKILK